MMRHYIKSLTEYLIIFTYIILTYYKYFLFLSYITFHPFFYFAGRKELQQLRFDTERVTSDWICAWDTTLPVSVICVQWSFTMKLTLLTCRGRFRSCSTRTHLKNTVCGNITHFLWRVASHFNLKWSSPLNFEIGILRLFNVSLMRPCITEDEGLGTIVGQDGPRL